MNNGKIVIADEISAELNQNKQEYTYFMGSVSFCFTYLIEKYNTLISNFNGFRS